MFKLFPRIIIQNLTGIHLVMSRFWLLIFFYTLSPSLLKAEISAKTVLNQGKEKTSLNFNVNSKKDKKQLALTTLYTPKSINPNSLHMTGMGYRQKTITVQALQMTGMGYRQKTITVQALQMTGVGFTPRVFPVAKLFMEGMRYREVTVNTSHLLMSGMRSPSININTDKLFMSGMRGQQQKNSVDKFNELKRVLK